MSRTIRRKNMPASEERSWTYDTDEEHANLHGGWKKYSYHTTDSGIIEKWYFHQVAWGGMKNVSLAGKEYDKAWWKLHRDHHRNYWGAKKLYRNDWGSVRSKNRKNLNQWFRDPNVDVFFWEDVNTQAWD